MGAVDDPLLQGKERPAESPRCGREIRRSRGMQMVGVICGEKGAALLSPENDTGRAESAISDASEMD